MYVKSREEIQRRIADLDRQISEELATVRLPASSEARGGFPLLGWLIAGTAFAWWRFGFLAPDLLGLWNTTARYTFYAGFVLAFIALVRTVFWLVRGRNTNAYTDMSRTVQQLREERHTLQQELRQQDEKLGL